MQGISSDTRSFKEWHDHFTLVPFKSLSHQKISILFFYFQVWFQVFGCEFTITLVKRRVTKNGNKCLFKKPTKIVRNINSKLQEKMYYCNIFKYCFNIPIRLASTIGGNREMGRLYMTSQVSNITRKTTFSPIGWHVFQN